MTVSLSDRVFIWCTTKDTTTVNLTAETSKTLLLPPPLMSASTLWLTSDLDADPITMKMFYDHLWECQLACGHVLCIDYTQLWVNWPIKVAHDARVCNNFTADLRVLTFEYNATCGHYHSLSCDVTLARTCIEAVNMHISSSTRVELTKWLNELSRVHFSIAMQTIVCILFHFSDGAAVLTQLSSNSFNHSLCKKLHVFYKSI